MKPDLMCATVVSFLRRIGYCKASFYLIAIFMFVTVAGNSQLLKVGVVGLSHDHAHSIMQQFKKGEVIIVGIAESDDQLIDRYKKRYQLSESLFYKTTDL